MSTEIQRTIKIGVIGAGHAATSTHLPILARLSGVRLEAICDVDTELAKQVAARFRIPRVYGQAAEILEEEDLEAVDILTPPDSHAGIAVQAMRRGRTCLMEKPLATSTRDADTVIAVAEETGTSVHVTYNQSFFPEVRRAKAVVASGDIGRLLSVDVRYSAPLSKEAFLEPSHWGHRLPGGVFGEIAPHLAMLILDFLPEAKVVGAFGSKVSNFPHIRWDELRVIVESGQCLGSFTVSLNSPFTRLEIAAQGEEGAILTNSDTRTLVVRRPVKGFRVVRTPMEGIPRALGVLQEMGQQATGLLSTSLKVIAGRLSYLEGHRYLITRSIGALRGDGTYPISLPKCRDATRLLESAWEELEVNGEDGTAGSVQLQTVSRCCNA